MKMYKESRILLIAGPVHPDDCSHCAECYLFSYQQKTSTHARPGFQGTVPKPHIQKYDVYLHRQYQMKHMDVCIRYGDQDQYISTYNKLFLMQDNKIVRNLHNPHVIAHDMIWKMKVDGMTAKEAFATLALTRTYTDDNA